MLVGYARVSTKERNFDLQIDRLKKEGCDKIFQDTVTGSKIERQGLNDAIEYLREGGYSGGMEIGPPGKITDRPAQHRQ